MSLGVVQKKGRLNRFDVPTNQWEKQLSYDVIEDRGGPDLQPSGKPFMTWEESPGER